MINFTIDPESIERFRESVRTVRPLRIGGSVVSLVINSQLPPGAIAIAPPWMYQYYQDVARDAQYLADAAAITHKTPAQIRALAAQSPLPFHEFAHELIMQATRP